MGDAQSAQREGKKDAAAAAAEEEESGKVDDVQIEGNIEDKPLKTNGQISELNGKADSTIAAINGHCEDDIAAEAILCANEDIKQTEQPLKGVTKEETLENADINEKTLPDEVDANEEAPEEVIEMDAKQNDINESFKRFFSNIGLKLTVKRGSTVEIPTNVPEGESNEPEEEVKEAAEEMRSENTEQNVDFNTAQEAHDNDSTTCQTTTDVTSDNFLENAEEKSTETKEEVQSDNVEAEMTSSVGEDALQGAVPEEEPRPTSPTCPEEEVIESPLKRFFTTGIFSGLRKKKKSTEDDVVEKELLDMGKNEATEETVQDQQEAKDTATGVDAALDESELKEESSLEKAKSVPVDQEKAAEILNSQEKEKVQASPLKKLLSGSSLKKQKKRQKGRKSSNAKSSDSGEHVSDQLLSSTESAENQKEETPAQPPTETAREEDSAWASFKKLLTPKKRVKKSTSVQEETQIPAQVEEAKPSEGEQISDHSTEEGKKRKDSSVSWEAVLCGSGKRRSRKTSDSEDESPHIDDNKQDSGPKESAESPPESSDEVHETDILSAKQAGSPPEDDGGSTWKSFKKLVTPKRKSKDEDESKDIVQSDSEVTQDETSFSMKKLLPGRKKRKSAEKQDQVSSDEAEREIASDDEDSETPAVVPLSEFDTAETVVQIQTQADVESYQPKEGDTELQKDLIDETAEPVLPCENLGAEEVQDDEALANEVSKVPITTEEPDDLTESISKHQQLSDIPEEGLITETMATPATEEGNKDDTIAEEITSDAVTAPEPADVTTADETEMMSAVSQLSESSKTSGNTTPVPAEYDVKDTEYLLQQVAETISLSPTAIPVYTEEPSSERIVCLNTEAIDAISDLAATAQTESLSDMKEAISTEIASEVPTEEFDTADTAVDEVHTVLEVQESIKELEMTDVEMAKVVTEEGSLEQQEKDTLKAASQEAELAPAEAEETTDVKQEFWILAEKEDQIGKEFQVEDEAPLVADEALISAEEAHVESLEKEVPPSQDMPPEETDTQELKETAAEHLSEEVQGATLDSEESEPLEKEAALSDDIQPVDIERMDVPVEQEIKEPQTDAPKEDHYEVTEEQEDVQDAALDSEEDQPLEKEAALSEDIPTADTDEPNEQENKEPQTDVEHEEIQVLEVVKSATDSEESSVQPLEKEESLLEDIPVADIDTEEPKETEEYPPEVTVESENIEPQSDASKEEVQEVTETVEAEIFDSEQGSFQSLEKEVPLSEDIPVTDVDTEEPEEAGEHPPEVTVEPENKEPETDASKDEVQEVTETLDSEEGSVQYHDKEVPLPESIPAADIDTDELKQSAEPENKEPLTDAPETDHSEVLEDAPSAVLDSEEGTAQSLEKKVTLEDVAAAEMVKYEPEEETVPTGVNVEPEDASKTQHSEEPDVLQPEQVATSDSEAGGPLLLEKEAISEDIPAVETDELKHVTEINVESEKEEEPVEPDVTEPEAETKSAQSAEESSAQEDTSEAAPEKETASVTEEIETKVVAQVDPALEINEDQKTESAAQEVKDSIPEVVDEIQPVSAVQVSFVNEEASSIQLLEKTVFYEETPAPHVNNAGVSDEPTHEGHLCAVQVNTEGEKVGQLPEAETKTAAAKHAVVAQVITCNLKDVSAAIPDVLIEKPSEVREPMIDKVVSETELKETIETATLLEVKDSVTETAEEGNAVIMMHVPAAEFEDNHRIQVQVVDVDIKSAQNIVDAVIEVGVTETKEVIDVYQENIDEVENQSATAEIEADVTNEENKVTVQEVTQHVKESLPETAPEPLAASMEQEGKKQADAVTEESEMVESGESKVVEGHEVMKDSPETSMEGQEEVTAAISDNYEITTENQESESFKQLSDFPETLDEFIHDQKEDLETKAEKSEMYVLAQETTQQLAVKKASETDTERQGLQSAQNQIVTPSNAALAVPQNTGIISSVGNVESPSSLSLEFKLNIQFGGVKAPAPLPPPIERTEPVKHTDVSEVGIQAVEPVETVRLTNATQTVENEKQVELTEVAVQATESQEPALDSTETAVIANLPVLLDVGIQVMETAETVEKIQSTERVTPNVQAAEIIQPVRQTERREVFLSLPELSETCDQEAEEEPVKQTEEETDQDVWLDAEEDILTQEKTEAPPPVMEEPIESQAESKAEEKVEAEHEFEMAPNMKTEEEDNQQEAHSAEGLCDAESDSEDFAVALEHPEVSTATVTAEDWD
ncbi:A-kinase anchor protein 12 [Parambassis ranga]|uniref:A-kinase anchor protein 12 n=1 Tax=Parambassis ranga TaxID=210632 RepID=A0A6P7HDM0_9TELE|nr:A-kinase anchor protein 12-like [Parambassis ranga]